MENRYKEGMKLKMKTNMDYSYYSEDGGYEFTVGNDCRRISGQVVTIDKPRQSGSILYYIIKDENNERYTCVADMLEPLGDYELTWDKHIKNKICDVTKHMSRTYSNYNELLDDRAELKRKRTVSNIQIVAVN